MYETKSPKYECLIDVMLDPGANNYIILDGLEGDTRLYCPRC